MKLKPGSYKVEVTRAGYQRSVELFEFKSGNQVYAVELAANSGRTPTVPAPQQVTQSRRSYEPEMVAIPAGRFRMGCVTGKDCSNDEKPVHNVTVAALRWGDTK